MQRLFASLFVADFPVAALTRGEDDLPPTAVIEGVPPNQYVYAVEEAGRDGGVRLGMPIAEAVARFAFSSGGELRIFQRDSNAEARAQRDLLRLAETVTPCYEDSAPGLVALDLTGLGEPHAAAQVLFDSAEKLGFTPQTGVSRNRFVALCAARTQPGLTHIYPGDEAGFLAVQGLDVLPLEAAEIETFTRWGLRTIGDLARLRESDLTARFGKRGALLSRMSRGEESSVLDAYMAPPQLEERQDFDWEVGELEPLAFALSGMLERLCARLQNHNLAAASIETKLELASGRMCTRKIELPYPLTDPLTLLRLVRLDLERQRPGEAIVAARIAASPTDRRRTQFSLFAPATPNPEKLAVTLARLAALVGADRVGCPVVPDTHKPGAASIMTFAPKVARQSTAASSVRRTRPFRVFRPPWPATIQLVDQEPVYLETLELTGAIESRTGPWRVSGEWWTEQGWQYEEWDVLVQGRSYRVCLDRQDRCWFVTGAYD